MPNSIGIYIYMFSNLREQALTYAPSVPLASGPTHGRWLEMKNTSNSLLVELTFIGYKNEIAYISSTPRIPIKISYPRPKWLWTYFVTLLDRWVWEYKILNIINLPHHRWSACLHLPWRLSCFIGCWDDQTPQEGLVRRNKLCVWGWSTLAVRHLCGWFHVSEVALASGTRFQRAPILFSWNNSSVKSLIIDGFCGRAPKFVPDFVK